MWVCAIAYLISHREFLFEGQLRRQAESPAHRGEFVVDILKQLHVSDLLGKGADRVLLAPGTSLRGLLQKLKETRGSAFPVVAGESKKLVGVLQRRHFQEVVDLETLSDLVVVQDLMRTSFKALGRWQDLDQALTALINENAEELPVVDEEGRFQGMITRDQIVQAYTNESLELRLGKP